MCVAWVGVVVSSVRRFEHEFTIAISGRLAPIPRICKLYFGQILGMVKPMGVFGYGSGWQVAQNRILWLRSVEKLWMSQRSPAGM